MDIAWSPVRSRRGGAYLEEAGATVLRGGALLHRLGRRAARRAHVVLTAHPPQHAVLCRKKQRRVCCGYSTTNMQVAKTDDGVQY